MKILSNKQYYELRDGAIRLRANDFRKEKRIENAIKYIKEHTDKLKTTRVPKIDFNYNVLLKIIGDKENE